MLRRLLIFVSFLVFFAGCSVKQETLNTKPEKMDNLTHDLIALGKGIDPKEAKNFAKEALSYSRELAGKYRLMAPANFHNFLINMGYRERGLCYEWSEDMMEHLKKQKFKSFDLRWGVAYKGEPMEHNSVVVVAKGASFESGLLIDPWRDSGELYWGKMHDDIVFKWVEDKQRSLYLGTISSK